MNTEEKIDKAINIIDMVLADQTSDYIMFLLDRGVLICIDDIQFLKNIGLPFVSCNSRALLCRITKESE